MSYARRERDLVSEPEREREKQKEKERERERREKETITITIVEVSTIATSINIISQTSRTIKTVTDRPWSHGDNLHLVISAFIVTTSQLVPSSFQLLHSLPLLI